MYGSGMGWGRREIRCDLALCDSVWFCIAFMPAVFAIFQPTCPDSQRTENCICFSSTSYQDSLFLQCCICRKSLLAQGCSAAALSAEVSCQIAMRIEICFKQVWSPSAHPTTCHSTSLPSQLTWPLQVCSLLGNLSGLHG